MKRALAIVIAGLAANAGGLAGRFVYDDHSLVEHNVWLRGLAFWRFLVGRSYWATDLDKSASWGGVYRPLTLVSYAADHALHGLSPFGFHLTNLALHLAVCLALWRLLLKLGAAADAALLAALAFAVLPVHVEAVAWIAGRPELLGSLFVLLSWLVLAGAKRPARLAAGWLLFALALLCKENMAMFPAGLIATELILAKKPFKITARERAAAWLGLLVTGLLWLEWRQALLGVALRQRDIALYFDRLTAAVVWPTMAKFLAAHYLWPMATGLGLRVDFTRPALPDSSLADPAAWAALLSLAALVAAGVYGFSKRRPWAAAVLWFLILLFPVSNLVLRVGVIGAERFLYLPSAGFCVLLGLAAARRPSRAKTAAAAALLAWWTFASARRTLAWASDEALWTAESRFSPQGVKTLLSLGIVDAQAGRHDLARRRFQALLALAPDDPDAAYALGKSYFEDGRLDEAERFLLPLSKKRPDKDAFCLLGLIAEKRGRLDEARAHYERALALMPYFPLAHRDLGLLLARTGKVPEGLSHLQIYLRLADGDPEADDVRRFLASLPRR